MRIRLLLIALCILPLASATQTGFCTGQYVEQGPNFQEGLIQEGDVFEYWCELPERLDEAAVLDITVSAPNAQAMQTIFLPRAIFGTSLVIFP